MDRAISAGDYESYDEFSDDPLLVEASGLIGPFHNADDLSGVLLLPRVIGADAVRHEAFAGALRSALDAHQEISDARLKSKKAKDALSAARAFIEEEIVAVRVIRARQVAAGLDTISHGQAQS